MAGGGGGGDPPSSNPNPNTGATAAATFMSGRISGFGSVIINGVRFDDSKAKVEDEFGDSVKSGELALGASVEVESDKITAAGKATASVLRVITAVRGPVEVVDATTQTLTVMGQTVKVDTNTIFDAALPNGLASVSVGQILQVHAQLDSTTSAYIAGRVGVPLDVSTYRVRGAVANLDTTAKTFTIGTAVFNYGSLTSVPASLANGQNVSVKTSTTPVNGQWVVTKLRNGKTERPDHAEGEVHGLITAFTSATSFTVGDTVVDATAATFSPSQSAVVLGAAVEVHGTVTNGVLVADKVSVRDPKKTDHSEDFELHGAIGSLDTTAKSFVLRGVTVNYGGTVTYGSGVSEATLANALKVEVKGSLSTDRTSLTEPATVPARRDRPVAVTSVQA